MRRALVLVALVVACRGAPDFKPAGSVSFTASPSSFGRAKLGVGFDPLSAPMIVLTSEEAPSCGSDMISMASTIDRVLVLNLYDASGDMGFQPIGVGDYPIAGQQTGRFALANYYERCVDTPFNADAATGTVHVTRVDADTQTLEGSYTLVFTGQGVSTTLKGAFTTTNCGAYDTDMTWSGCG